MTKSTSKDLGYVRVCTDDVSVRQKSSKEHTNHAILVYDYTHSSGLKKELKRNFFSTSKVDVPGVSHQNVKLNLIGTI